MQVTVRFVAIAALALGAAGLFLGQTPVPAPLPATDEIYACPMDPDVRSHAPGTCPRCGMKLAAGIPDPVEYTMDLKVIPPAPKPMQPTRLQFLVRDPWKERPVTSFQIVHERLFHMFVVSQDLQFFVHDHPVFEPEGDFVYSLAFPKPGMYRVLGDFYPDGATPQLIAKTVIVQGTPPPAAVLPRDYSTKQGENMQVEKYPGDMLGSDYHEISIAKNPVKIEGPITTISNAPGLGVDVDWDLVRTLRPR